MPKDTQTRDHALIVSRHDGDTVIEVHTFPTRKAALEWKTLEQAQHGATLKYTYRKVVVH